jgi:hypothetical protein
VFDGGVDIRHAVQLALCLDAYFDAYFDIPCGFQVHDVRLYVSM